jgi:hypothetical protein
MDEKTPTYGGYSSQIVVDEDYALKISATGKSGGVSRRCSAPELRLIRRSNVLASAKVKKSASSAWAV